MAKLVIVGGFLLSFLLFLAAGSPDDSEDNDDGDDSAVVTLTDANFDELVQEGKSSPWFIEFYAPWCGHCKSLAPKWDQLPALLEGKVKVGKVDTTVEKSTGEQFEIQGFPTLKLIASGKMYSYSGEREVDPMVEWAGGGYASTSAENLPKDKTFIDDIIKKMKTMAEGIGQVMSYMPLLLPSIFFIGSVFGLILAYIFGSCRRGKVPRDCSETVAVKLARDDKGTLGLEINPLTMKVVGKDTRQMLDEIQIGDTIVAVNKADIVDADDYRRAAHGVKEFTLTLGRPAKPANVATKKEQ